MSGKKTKKKIFDHYMAIYTEGLKEIVKEQVYDKNINVYTRVNEALNKMIIFYPEQTKSLLVESMNSSDIRIAIISAVVFARTFDMDVETKNKARIIKKNFCNSKYCTPIMKVGLAGFPDIHNRYK